MPFPCLSPSFSVEISGLKFQRLEISKSEFFKLLYEAKDEIISYLLRSSSPAAAASSSTSFDCTFQSSLNTAVLHLAQKIRSNQHTHRNIILEVTNEQPCQASQRMWLKREEFQVIFIQTNQSGEIVWADFEEKLELYGYKVALVNIPFINVFTGE
jgi:hypothetical protein